MWRLLRPSRQNPRVAPSNRTNTNMNRGLRNRARRGLSIESSVRERLRNRGLSYADLLAKPVRGRRLNNPARLANPSAWLAKPVRGRLLPVVVGVRNGNTTRAGNNQIINNQIISRFYNDFNNRQILNNGRFLLNGLSRQDETRFFNDIVLLYRSNTNENSRRNAVHRLSTRLGLSPEHVTNRVSGAVMDRYH